MHDVTIEFRLVVAGDPERPVVVFPVWEEDGQLILLEGEFSEPLTTPRSLEELTVEDLPSWLLEQALLLEVLPPRTAVGRTAADAVRAVQEAAHAAWKRPSRERDVAPAEAA
jgi:hypothetical protein